jgi:hypothetical protein
MIKRKDLSGQVFEDLEVVKYLYTDKNKKAKWLCKCACGNFCTASGNHLVQGRTKSCGHRLITVCREVNTTHGMRSSRQYRIWCGMKERCDNPNSKNYQLYGGRGISYTPRWAEFEGFWEDMHTGYEPHLTLERKNPDIGYSPDNCVWATTHEQARNHRAGKNNTSGVMGVFLNTQRGQWTALWNDSGGRQRNSSFSIKKYGENAAFQLACEARLQEIANLEKEGIFYSEFHGNKQQEGELNEPRSA